MQKRSRKLRLLHIDDGRRRSATSESVPPGLQPPDLIDLLRLKGPTEELVGIQGFHDALLLWSRANDLPLPDLVVGDVIFELDERTPLHGVVVDNKIPTGIFHLIPFAAIARFSRKPMGLALHTVTPTLLGSLRRSSREAEVIARFAAHGIGELAAILGDLSQSHLAQGSFGGFFSEDREQILGTAWDWLQARSAHQFLPAVKVAMADYRRKLLDAAKAGPNQGGIWIPAKEWNAVMSWCESMRREPKLIADDNDPGLLICHVDGTRDQILLSSIFADVDRIDRKVLHADSFAIKRDSDDGPIFKLDDNGRPKIGAFLQELGRFTSVLDRATRIATYFVDQLASEKLGQDLVEYVRNEQSGNEAEDDLAAGFALLFVYVYGRKRLHDDWQQKLDRKWEPRKLRSSPKAAMSMRKFLERLAKFIKRRTKLGDHFTRDDICNPGDEIFAWGSLSADDADENWLKWHVERLIDAGFLSVPHVHEGEEVYCRRANILGSIRRPASEPRRRRNVDDDYDTAWLNDALGFGVRRKVNPHRIGEVMQRAFVRAPGQARENAPLGRAFLDQFKQGEAPGWIVAACREYAECTLDWGDRAVWPRCLLGPT